jgi:hypothetical protein
MSVNLSPQMRVVALAGGLAALALLGGFTMLGRMQPASSAAPLKQIKPLHPVKKTPAAKSAAALPVAKKAVARKAVPAKAKPAVTEPAEKKPAAKKPAAPAAVPNPNGLPLVIARALATHQVVAVSLYDPEAHVDAISLAEAEAGAKLAGVGFVGLNVLSQAQSHPLTSKLGVLPDPGLLIYRRPGDLVLRIDGFVDRDTVAQAARNVAPVTPVAQASLSPSVSTDDWAASANKVCGNVYAKMKKVEPPTTRAQLLSSGPALLALEDEFLGRLGRVAKPTVAAQRARVDKLLALERKGVAEDKAVFAAVKSRDQVAAGLHAAREKAIYAEADTLARSLGATGCVSTAAGMSR